MPLSTELEFHPLILVTHRHRAPDEITPACGCPQGWILAVQVGSWNNYALEPGQLGDSGGGGPEEREPSLPWGVSPISAPHSPRRLGVSGCVSLVSTPVAC